ncbi:MAG: tRNA (adenosine(37)-N6)-dimethylallyltransferase MiaA [Parcubacteria group bacterium]|nr:tRNA (adenosine(37)-N6)-dimethylallyltransferase MiaA [Parcubacteria group bacterium]
MTKVKKKIILILGQTATGKSDLAVKIAKKFNGEIISADSRQVYKGLDIGTGKITKKEMRGVPHYMLDVLNPKRQFTAAEYKQKAEKAIQHIIQKGKTPIIVGGTGFYIDTLLGTVILPNIPPNKKLRVRLQKKTVAQLFKELKKRDRGRAKTIDKHNKVRLIRALEIVHALGKVPGAETGEKKYDVLKIGLTLPNKQLKQKISIRLFARIRGGMTAEVKKLHARGLSWRRMEELGLEYRYLAQYLQNKITRDEMINKLNTAISQYARRQKTWFKRDKNIQWFKPNEYKKIYSKINSFLEAT